MSYPKIPPHCEFFGRAAELKGSVYFVFPLRTLALATLGEELYVDKWRKLIACTARCAGLDEAECLSEVCWYDVNVVRDSAKAEDFRAYHLAVEYAEQWRKWGRGEPWE